MRADKSVADILIVGAPSDPHVTAVAERLPDDRLLILDCESLARSQFSIEANHIEVEGTSNTRATLASHSRGWLRRLAPPDWMLGIPNGSKESVIRLSWFALLGGLLRIAPIRWLTQPELAIAAENKLCQMHAASRADIPFPDAIITSRVESAVEHVGDPFVVKPLGPADFIDSAGERKAVFSELVASDQIEDSQLSGAPFLAQRFVSAKAHYRVVTVRDRAWTCRIEAPADHIDWRLDPVAHRSFTSVEHRAAELLGVRMAKAMQVGFSSQDWIESDNGLFFLDLNPGGQWLFLPDSVADEVTTAIATALQGMPEEE